MSESRQRVVAIVQARMGSTRLPGKALARLGGKTAIELVVSRLRRAQELEDVVLATSTDPSDDPIVREAARLSVRVVRGPLDDVLARYVQACAAAEADGVVRITADCPLSDPDIVDHAVVLWRSSGADYVTNTLDPRSYPDGFDVEVVSAEALRRVAEQATSNSDREHVTTFIRRHPDRFSVAEFRLDPPLQDIRVTIDTIEDLRLLQRLIDELGPDASIQRVLRALGHEPSPVVFDRT